MGTDTHTREGYAADVLADAWHHASGAYAFADVRVGAEDALGLAEAVLQSERDTWEAEAAYGGTEDTDAARMADAVRVGTVRPWYVEDDRTGSWRVGAWTIALGDGSRVHVHAFPDGTASGAFAVDDGTTRGPWDAWWSADVLAEARGVVLARAAEAVREAARSDVGTLAEAAAAYGDVAAWASEADVADVAADVAVLVAEEWAARVRWDANYAADRAASAVRDALALRGDA